MRNGSIGKSESNSSLTGHIRTVLADRGVELDTPVLVACSGGRDSVVLAEAVVNAGYHEVALAHVDHGIRSASERTADRKLVTELAQRLHVPVSFRVIPPGEIEAHALDRDESLESLARQRRYQELQQAIAIDDERPRTALLTAHHNDDVAETVLMRVLSGRSPYEPLGIEVETSINGMRVLRPLIGVSGAAISRYAGERDLSWHEDTSNNDDAYLRNYVRHTVIPEVSRRFVSVSTHLARFHWEHQELRGGLEDLIPEDAWGEIASDTVWNVSCTVFCGIPRAAQEMVLRRAHKKIVPGVRSSFRPVLRSVEQLLNRRKTVHEQQTATVGGVAILITEDVLSLRARIVRPEESGYLLEVPEDGCIQFWLDARPTRKGEEYRGASLGSQYLGPVVPPVVVRELRSGDRLVTKRGEKRWNELFRGPDFQEAVKYAHVIEDMRGTVAMVCSSDDYIVRDGVTVGPAAFSDRPSVCVQFNV